MAPKNFWYVASPYSAVGTEDPAKVMEERYREALAFCAWAVRGKMFVYSPIAHWHSVAQRYNLPTDANSWTELNNKLILGGGGVMVLCLPGWKASKGVRQEIAFAHSHGLPVHFAVFDQADSYSIHTHEPR